MMQQKQRRTLFRRAYERSVKAVKRTLVAAGVIGAVGATAIACGGRSGGVCPDDSPVCFPTRADSGMGQQDGAPQHDAGNDAVRFDAVVPQRDGGIDSGTQTDAIAQTDSGTDSGVQPPPKYSYTINNLIGDFLNRDLGDRDKGQKAYPLGADTDPNANPFTDGTGASALGPADTYLNRVDGTMFPPFVTVTLEDTSVARTYTEQQDFWMRGESHYSDAAKSVIGRLNSVAYTLKFKGASDEFGIPVCAIPAATDYTACKDPTSTMFNMDNATETHKLRLNFLGDVWVVTEMVPPSGMSLPTETQLVSGGYVKLAKEVAGGIINVYDDPLYPDAGLLVDNLTFRLDGFSSNGGYVAAIISVLDSSGNILKKDEVAQGETKVFVINGKSYLLHAWKVAPGVQPGARWADLSVFSKEMKLESGYSLDVDNGTNKYWTVYLGWKNKGASATDTQPDHLRTIILHSDQISKLSSGGSQDLLPGDYLPIVQDPALFKFYYTGLSQDPSTFPKLTVQLERNATITFEASEISGGPCVLNIPSLYVQANTSPKIFFLGSNGVKYAESSDFYVAANGGDCNGNPLSPGAVFMRKSPSSSEFVLQAMPLGGDNDVMFPAVADSTGANGGYIRVLNSQELGYPDIDPSLKVAVVVVESAGEGIAADSLGGLSFPVKAAGSLSSLNSDVYVANNSMQLFKKDTIRYDYAGPVSSGINFADEGFTTERGSVFTSITDTTVTFDIAGQLVYSQFMLATTATQ